MSRPPVHIERGKSTINSGRKMSSHTQFLLHLRTRRLENGEFVVVLVIRFAHQTMQRAFVLALAAFIAVLVRNFDLARELVGDLVFRVLDRFLIAKEGDLPKGLFATFSI